MKNCYPSSMLMSGDKNTGMVKNVFHTLNNRAKKRMPVIKKAPALLPVGWIYVGVNHLVMMAKGERPKV